MEQAVRIKPEDHGCEVSPADIAFVAELNVGRAGRFGIREDVIVGEEDAGRDQKAGGEAAAACGQTNAADRPARDHALFEIVYILQLVAGNDAFEELLDLAPVLLAREVFAQEAVALAELAVWRDLARRRVARCQKLRKVQRARARQGRLDSLKQ